MILTFGLWPWPMKFTYLQALIMLPMWYLCETLICEKSCKGLDQKRTSNSHEPTLCFSTLLCYVRNPEVEKSRHFHIFPHIFSTWPTHINATSVPQRVLAGFHNKFYSRVPGYSVYDFGNALLSFRYFFLLFYLKWSNVSPMEVTSTSYIY